MSAVLNELRRSRSFEEATSGSQRTARRTLAPVAHYTKNGERTFFNVSRKGNGTPVPASASAAESSRGFPRQVIPGEKWGRRKSKQIAATPAHGAETSVAALVEAALNTRREARSQEKYQRRPGAHPEWRCGCRLCVSAKRITYKHTDRARKWVKPLTAAY